MCGVASATLREHKLTSAYRPDIDGLRALAIGLVIAYHGFPQIRTGGFLGVDVFFVISGYLITRLILDGRSRGSFTLAEFYRRRVRRIVPALLVVFVACGIAGWMFLLPSEMRWLAQAGAWAAPFLANVFFARTSGYFDRAVDFNPLLHLWSLGVEEQFYILWPLLLIAAIRYGVTSMVFAAVTLTSLAISIWGASYSPAAHFYLPAPRAWELAVGGMLVQWQMSTGAQAWQGPRANILRHAGSCLGLVLILAGALLWTANIPIPGLWSLIPVAGAALLIGAGPQALVNRWILGSGPMVWIGKISYPLYLWHWPLFSFSRIFLGHAAPALLAAAQIVVAVGVAWITYVVIEQPIRRGKFGLKAAPALLTALACVGLAGGAMARGWIPGRLTGSFYTAWDDAAADWHYPGKLGGDGFRTLATLGVSSGQDRKVLYLGDSHSQQYWPRVAAIIQAHQGTARSAIFSSSLGCPPLPGIRGARRGHECPQLFEYTMKRALEPDVDTVVFTAFWEKYFLGEYELESSRFPICSSRDASCEPLELNSAQTGAIFADFERTVQRLVASGRRVFIVLSNPTAPQFTPLFPLPLRIWPQGTLARDAGPFIDDRPYERFVAPISNLLRRVAAEAGATVLDPRLTLCPGEICSATGEDGLPRYLDSNHLRGDFARQHATFIDQTVLEPATD